MGVDMNKHNMFSIAASIAKEEPQAPTKTILEKAERQMFFEVFEKHIKQETEGWMPLSHIKSAMPDFAHSKLHQYVQLFLDQSDFEFTKEKHKGKAVWKKVIFWDL